MYYSFTVPISKAQGKITRMKKGKFAYIQFETGRTYYPDKKYTIPVRVSIGKLDPNHPAMMYPNEQSVITAKKFSILGLSTLLCVR